MGRPFQFWIFGFSILDFWIDRTGAQGLRGGAGQLTLSQHDEPDGAQSFLLADFDLVSSDPDINLLEALLPDLLLRLKEGAGCWIESVNPHTE
jgi:hypothetical protein